MKEKVSCAQRLKYALGLRGLKQSDLCGRTGIGKSAMSQYLKGTIEPRQDRVELLAKSLGVSPAWLMGYDVPMELADVSQDGGWSGHGYYTQFNTPEGMSRLDNELAEKGIPTAFWAPSGETGRELVRLLSQLPEEKLLSVLDYARFLQASGEKKDGFGRKKAGERRENGGGKG